MTDPAKSKYQATPWQPTIDTSNGDQKKAGEDYTEVYGGTPTYGKPDEGGDPVAPIGVVPELKVNYTAAPDLVPTQQATDGTSTDAGMRLGAFNINLGALRTAEQSCLDATASCVNEYEDLKGVVTNAINSDNLFGQLVGSVSSNSGYTWLSAGGWGTTTNLDPLDKEGTEFAESINPQLHNLLVSAAGVIELMGVFTAMLNNAGQMYTYTDSSAAFTDLP